MFCSDFLKTTKSDNSNPDSKRALPASKVGFLGAASRFELEDDCFLLDFLECDFRERAANFELIGAAPASSRMTNRPLTGNTFWTPKTCPEDFGERELARPGNLLTENAQTGSQQILNFGTLQRVLLKLAECGDKTNQVSQLAEDAFPTCYFQSCLSRLLDRRA